MQRILKRIHLKWFRTMIKMPIISCQKSMIAHLCKQRIWITQIPSPRLRSSVRLKVSIRERTVKDLKAIICLWTSTLTQIIHGNIWDQSRISHRTSQAYPLGPRQKEWHNRNLKARSKDWRGLGQRIGTDFSSRVFKASKRLNLK